MLLSSRPSESEIKAVRHPRQPSQHNGSIDRSPAYSRSRTGAQARPLSVWHGHWELSELIQMLIGPQADWSVAFLLLSTSHTLQLTGTSKNSSLCPSLRPLFGAQKSMNVPLDCAVQLPSVLTDEPESEGCIVFRGEFQWQTVGVRKSTRPRVLGTFLLLVAVAGTASARRVDEAERGPLWEERVDGGTELARGLAASVLRGVIVTGQAAKASTIPKAKGGGEEEGGQKHVFTLDDAVFFVSSQSRLYFLDLNQMLHVMRTPSASARLRSSWHCQPTTRGSVCFPYTSVAEFRVELGDWNWSCARAGPVHPRRRPQRQAG